MMSILPHLTPFTNRNAKTIDLPHQSSFSFVLSDKLLGIGSYGSVYQANDETGKPLAVKCCAIEYQGIPNIMEASIMSSISHPYINNAIRIQATEKKLYIIQELAQTDLAQHTRRSKGNYRPSITELRDWTYCLIQAVATLHRQKIIHADIKSNNVLLMPNGTVRLTDFTLATKKWLPHQYFRHNACTSTHRPLESFLGELWDESLDIWSLGCTLYEIAYGELLFPVQQKNDNKNRLKEKYMACLVDWNDRGPHKPITLSFKKSNLAYHTFSFCSEVSNSQMSQFNDLIFSMLHTSPKNRLTIFQALQHPFFKGLTPVLYLAIQQPLSDITIEEHARVSRYIYRYIEDQTVAQVIHDLAISLYRQCHDLQVESEHLKAAGCAWIANKIVLGYAPDLQALASKNSVISISQMLPVEREICHNLQFRLHNI